MKKNRAAYNCVSRKNFVLEFTESKEEEYRNLTFSLGQVALDYPEAKVYKHPKHISPYVQRKSYKVIYKRVIISIKYNKRMKKIKIKKSHPAFKNLTEEKKQFIMQASIIFL